MTENNKQEQEPIGVPYRRMREVSVLEFREAWAALVAAHGKKNCPVEGCPGKLFAKDIDSGDTLKMECGAAAGPGHGLNMTPDSWYE